jgi:hypothetical protein
VARIEHRPGRLAEAERQAGSARAEAGRTRFVRHEPEARLVQGQLGRERGRHEAARACSKALEHEAAMKGFRLAERKATAELGA